jgi:hypothetical protein
MRMTRPAESEQRCAGCGRSAAERQLPTLDGAPHCLGYALRRPSLLRRSAVTALVVGTVLTAINQGTVLAAGEFPRALLWKIPLTYAVPYCVATWGALANTRLPAPDPTPPDTARR